MKNIIKWKITIVLFLIFSFVLLPTFGYCQIQSEKITIEKIEKLENIYAKLWENPTEKNFDTSTNKVDNEIQSTINTYVKNSNNIQIQQFMNDLIKMSVKNLNAEVPYTALADFGIAIRNNSKLEHEYQKKLLEVVSKNRGKKFTFALLEVVGLMNHWYSISYPSKNDQKIYLNLLEDPKSQNMIRGISALFLGNIQNFNLKTKIKDIVSNLLKSYKKQLREAKITAHKTGIPFTYPQYIVFLELAMKGLKGNIFYEVKVNNVARVKELLAKNPKLVNVKNKDGQTPLFLAASRGHINMAKLLLFYGANVNVKDNFGHTPLIDAVYAVQPLPPFIKSLNSSQGRFLKASITNHNHRIKDMIKLLLLHHANVNIKINGQTLLHYAEEKKYNSIADLFRQYGAKE